MIMLIVYLIYARFSPVHKAMFTPASARSKQSSDRLNCQTDDDCAIDHCHNCQVANKQSLSQSGICLVYCPVKASCVGQVCISTPR